MIRRLLRLCMRPRIKRRYRRLSETQRFLILALYADGLTLHEIARALDLSFEVTEHLHEQAMRALRGDEATEQAGLEGGKR